MIKGKAGFVLPKYKNTVYILINQGATFGVIDIVGSVLQNNHNMEEWMQYKDSLKHQFTTMATEHSEALNLNISDFWSMKQEFQETYKEFFDYTQITLRRCLTLMLKSMKICQEKDLLMGNENI